VRIVGVRKTGLGEHAHAHLDGTLHDVVGAVPSVSAVNRAGDALRTLTATANLATITAPDVLGIEQIFEALDTLEA
jgi:hypothetical protein